MIPSLSQPAAQDPFEGIRRALDNGGAVPPGIKDPSWYTTPWIAGDRWNKLYPYQLIVVEKTPEGYKAAQGNWGKWKFTLPIPPQDMTISTPFAISLSATLDGVLEEHNGAPIRTISMSGTTGVLPLRGNQDELKQSSFFEGVFGGTVQAAKDTAASVKKLLPGSDHNLNVINRLRPVEVSTSGYYQFRLLQQFLESYITVKKQQKGRNLRLAFAIWKDEAVYLVTPVTFDVRRIAQSPYEYMYSLVFRAWKRINLDDSFDGEIPLFRPIARDPNKFKQALNKFQEAREVLQSVKGVLSGVRGDINASVFSPLREIVLFCKDALAIPVAMMDLPKAIIQDMRGPLVEAMGLNHIDQKLRAHWNQTKKSMKSDLEDLKALATASGKAETGSGKMPKSQIDGAVRNAEINSKMDNRIAAGKDRAAVAAAVANMTGPAANFNKGRAALGQVVTETAHPAHKIFEDPDAHADLFSALTPSDLNLPPATQRKILEEKERVRKLGRLDFEAMRDTLVEFAAEFADAIGAGSASYDAALGRESRTSTRTPTADEFEALFALNDVITEMSRFAASGTIDRQQVTTLDYLAGAAAASGIAFKKPTSKFAVPFPYGSTLEQVSARYLGDPQRWMEIAALNGLQAPYVDEVGFTLPLLVNGRGNQIVVGDVSKLFVGQSVWIESMNTTRTRRRITRIDRIGNGYALYLDGTPDLDRYNVLARAQVQAFLPGTVNSSQLIYIPSEEPASEEDWRTKAIPGLDQFDPLIRVGGVDLLLTQQGDLAMTSDGDCLLAYGLTHIIQKVRVALGTPQGGLLHFPRYGFATLVGESTADVSVPDLWRRLEGLFAEDPTFTGVHDVAVSKRGPLLKIAFSVGVQGVEQLIPVSFDVKR